MRTLFIFLISIALTPGSLSAKTIVLKEGHTSFVTCVTFSPDGKNLLSAGYRESIIRWSLKGTLLKRHYGSLNTILNINFSKDSSTLLISDAYTSLRMVRPENFKNIMSVYEKYKHESTAALHPSGSHAAAGGRDGIIRIYNRKGKMIKTFKAHKSIITSLVYSSDGKNLYSGDRKGTWKTWNSSFRLVRKTTIADSAVTGIAPARDESLIAVSSKGKIHLYNKTGKILKTLEGVLHKTRRDKIYRIAFSPDGKRLAAALSDSHVRIWTARGSLLHNLKAHRRGVTCIAWSPDSRMLASSSYDKTVKLWSADAKLITTIERAVQIPLVTVKVNGADVTFLNDDKCFMPVKGVVTRGKLAENTTIKIKGTGYSFKKQSELFCYRNGILEKGILKEKTKINIGGSVYTLKQGERVGFYRNGSYSYLPIMEDPTIDGIKFETMKGFRGVEFHKSGKIFAGWNAEGITRREVQYKKGFMRFYESGAVLSGYLANDLMLQGILFKGDYRLTLFEDGKPLEAILKKNTRYRGITFKQGTRIRFYPGGAVARGTLLKNTRIRGRLFKSGKIIYFYSNQKVARGRLTSGRMIYFNKKGRETRRPMDTLD